MKEPLEPVSVNPAVEGDLPVLAVLAATLADLHHTFDPLRFFASKDFATGYLRFFLRELRDPNAAILVAKVGGEVAGYVYARKEGRDWNALLDPHAKLHDIFVSDVFRSRGVAKALLSALADRMRSLGVPRIVLHTAAQNERAQRIFAEAGYRTTMFEMTCEL